MNVGIVQPLNQALPHHVTFCDQTEKSVRLGDYFGCSRLLEDEQPNAQVARIKWLHLSPSKQVINARVAIANPRVQSPRVP